MAASGSETLGGGASMCIATHGPDRNRDSNDRALEIQERDDPHKRLELWLYYLCSRRRCVASMPSHRIAITSSAVLCRYEATTS